MSSKNTKHIIQKHTKTNTLNTLKFIFLNKHYFLFSVHNRYIVGRQSIQIDTTRTINFLSQKYSITYTMLSQNRTQRLKNSYIQLSMDIAYLYIFLENLTSYKLLSFIFMMKQKMMETIKI